MATPLFPHPGGRLYRAGIGFPLLFVLSLVLVLGLIGFHQLYQVSHLTDEASRGAWGDLALSSAESAVQELMFRIKSDVSNPGKPLFHELRRDVYDGESGHLTIQDSGRIDVTPGLLREAALSGVRVESTLAEVLFQKQFEDLPFERYGLIRYRARVTADTLSGRSVVRDLEVGQGFKVLLCSVPQPFDQAAVYLGDLWDVTDLEDANRTRVQLLQLVEELVAGLDTARALAPAALQSRYSFARGEVTTGPELLRRVPPLPEDRPAILLGTGVTGQQYPLSGLDVATRVREVLGRARPLAERAASALRGVESRPSSPDFHQRYLEALAEALEVVEDGLDRIWAYHEGYQILGVDSPRYASIVNAHRYLTVDHWRRVTSFDLSEAAGSTNQQRFDALRQSQSVMNGVVFVQGDDGPLLLRGNIPGKLVVVVAGGTVILEETQSGSRPWDLLTVVALGARVEVRGPVHASLVLGPLTAPDRGGSPDSVLVMSDGASLHGGLVARRLGGGSRLEGSVFRDDRYHSGSPGGGRGPSGMLTDRLAVLVSPREVYRKVLRK